MTALTSTSTGCYNGCPLASFGFWLVVCWQSFSSLLERPCEFSQHFPDDRWRNTIISGQTKYDFSQLCNSTVANSLMLFFCTTHGQLYVLLIALNESHQCFSLCTRDVKFALLITVLGNMHFKIWVGNINLCLFRFGACTALSVLELLAA